MIATQTAKFEAILNLEDAVRYGKVTAAFGGAGIPDFVHQRREDSLKADQAKLFAAIDALTAEEAAAFAEYRKAQRAV